MNKFLFKNIDGSALIVFRILFGFLVACESFGAIFTGWVKNVLIEPEFTFSFIDFEWLQPLPGNGMYFYFALMGLAGIVIMLGFRYKINIITFTILCTISRGITSPKTYETRTTILGASLGVCFTWNSTTVVTRNVIFNTRICRNYCRNC